MNSSTFYEELLTGLPSSDGKQRMVWAKCIIEEQIDIEQLFGLLYEGKKIAMRFSWLLSDVGILNAKSLKNVLPQLFAIRDKVTYADFLYSFAKYWNYVGVPEENKGEAIDLLFRWVEEPKMSVHIKTNAVTVLSRLVKEYPDLKNELMVVLEYQLDKNSVSFKRLAQKLLAEL